MKYIIFIFVLCSNAVFSQSRPNEKTLTHLKQFRNDLIQSQSDKKFERLQIYYADDFRLMPEFQETVKGKANTVLYDQAFVKHFEVQDYDRHETEVIDIGARVIEIGFFTMKLTLKAKQQQELVRGKYIDLWQKENEKLLLLTQAWNYDQSLPWENEFHFDEVPSENVALMSHVPIQDNASFELAALNRLIEKTISEHDDKVWVQFYSDDGNFFYSRHAPVAGKKSLTEFLEKHARELPIFEKLDIRNDRIDDLGKFVVEYASHIAIIRAGAFSGVFTGKDLAIWRREPNGSLKIFRHIGMYD